MMKTVLKNFCLIVLLFASLASHGQSWEKLIVGGGSSGNEVFSDMHIDQAGNVYLTGSFSGSTTFGNTLLTSNGATDFFVVKYDSSGNLIYAVSGGSSSGDQSNAIVSDNNGNAYITGFYTGFLTIAGTTLIINGSTDAFTIKVDTLGNFVWAKKSGGFFDFNGSTFQDRGIDITYDNNNGIYIAGVTSGQSMTFGAFLHGPGQGDATDFIGKYDLNGNEQWIVSSSDPNSGISGASSIAKTLTYSSSSNSIIVGGYNSILTSIGGGGISKLSDLYFRQILLNGTLGWYRQFGGAAQEEVQDIAIDASGNIYATGLYNGTLEIPLGNVVATSINSGQNSEVSDAFIVKLSPNASSLNYIKTVSGSQDIDGIGIASSPNGTIYVTGQYKGNPGVDNVALNPKGEYDIFLLRIDSIGTLNWVEEAGGNGDDVGVNLAVRNDEKIVFSGGFSNVAQFGKLTRTSLGFSDACLAELDCKPGLPALSISPDTLLCIGDTSEILLENKFGTDYSYNLLSGGTIDTLGGSVNVVWASSGNHQLQIIPSNVCGQGEIRTVNFRIKDVPANTLISGDTNICLGLGTYTALNPNANTFNWSLNAGGSLVPLNNQALVSWSGAGNFTLTVSGQNECGVGVKDSLKISVAQFPSGPTLITGNLNTCIGTDTFSVNPAVETSYSWNLSGGGILQDFDSFAVVQWTQPGTYIIDVTPSNICGTASPSSQIITVADVPSNINISGDTAVCIGSSSFSVQQINGAVYNWALSGGGTLLNLGNTAIVNWTSAGRYFITSSIQNSCGTSERDTIFVEVKSAAIQPGPINGNSQTCIGTNSYSVNQQSNQNYEWSLSSGGTLSFVNNQANVNWTQTGFHTLTVRAINDCGTGLSRDLVVEVRNVPNQPGIIFGNDEVCLGLENYNVFAESGVSYNWSINGGGQIFPSGNSVSVNWTLPGIYNLTVTPSNSCGNGLSRTLQTEVKDVPDDISGINGFDTVCLGSQIYTLENPQSGNDINYQWSLSGGGIIAPNGNSATVNWSNPGTYTLTVQAQNSCGFSQPFSKFITVRNTSSQISSINGDDEVCLDTSLYQVAYINGFSYNWSLSGGGILRADSNSANVLWQNTGNYTLSVTTSDGCSKSLPVEVKDIPEIPSAIGGDTVVCFGSKSYAVQPKTGQTFNWSVTGGGNVSGFGNAAIVNWSNTGNYSLQVSATNLCGTGPEQTLDVNVLTVPLAPVFNLRDTLVCKNQVLDYAVDSRSFETYSWSLNRGGLLSPQDSLVTVNWLDTGNSLLTVNATNLCGTGPAASEEIRVNDVPSAPVIFGQDQVCLDTNLYNTSFLPGLSYNWSLNTGGIINDSLNQAEIFWTDTGVYTIGLSLTNNCGSSPLSSLDVEVFDIPKQPKYVQGDSLVCIGLRAYSLENKTEETYSWSISGGGILNALNNSATINWTNTGFHQIFTQATNLCGTGPPDTFDIEVRDIPQQPSVISGDALVCLDNRAYSVNPVNDVTYNWSLNANGTLNAGDSNSVSIDWTSTGVSVLIVSASNLCGTGPSQSKSISINDIPGLPVLVSGDTISCIGNETYTLASNSGLSYNWTLANGGTLVPNSNQATVNWTQTGNWEIITSLSNFCGTGPEDTIFVRVKSLPQPLSFINPDTLVCLGNTLYQVNLEPETSYSWSLNGGGTLNTSINQALVSWNNPGNYSLSVVPSNICGSGPSTSQQIDVRTVPNSPVFIAPDTLSCLGQETYTVQNQSGASFLWNLSGGGGSSSNANQFIVNWTSLGTYDIEVSAFNFCGTSPVSSINVDVNRIPDIPQAFFADSNLCIGIGSYSVLPVQDVDFRWSTSGGGLLTDLGDSAVVGWLVPGIFSVNVRAENYCGSSNPLSLNVRVNEAPDIPSNFSGPTGICRGDTGTYSVQNISGLIYNWSTDLGDNISQDSSRLFFVWPQRGLRTLSVSAENDCGISPAAELEVNVRDVPDIQGNILGKNKLCQGERESYEVNNIEGQTYFWTLNGGGEISSQENLAIVDWQNPGLFTIALQASNICGLSDSVFRQVRVDDFPDKPLIEVKNDTLFSSTELDNVWYLNGEILDNAVLPFYIPQATGRYQLQIINSCGESALSEFLSYYNGDNLESEVYLIPNPAIRETRVQIPLNLNILSLKILDTRGKLILSRKEINGSRNNLFIDSLPPGLYIVEIEVSTGEKVSKKLVVN